MPGTSRIVRLVHQDDEDLWLLVEGTGEDEALCDVRLLTAIMSLFDGHLDPEANDGNPVLPIEPEDLGHEGFIITFRRDVTADDARQLEALLRPWLVEQGVRAEIRVEHCTVRKQPSSALIIRDP